MRHIVVIVVGLLLTGVAAAQAPEEADDERALKNAHLGTDAAELLRYFRQRTRQEVDPQELSRLVRSLGDLDFGVREQAFVRLAALGTGALAGLQQVEEDASPEVRRRVARLRQRVASTAEFSVQAAAVRTIARARPAGAAEVLLAYAPFVADTVVLDEIGKALGVLAGRDGQVDPAVAQALTARAAMTRGLAGAALARANTHLSSVRKLLQDDDPLVRLRVALALMAAKDRQAVGTLIDLIGQLDADELWRIEEVLVRLAGKDAPTVPLSNAPTTRHAAHTAWRAWFAGQKDLDWTRLAPAVELGLTLLVQQQLNVPRGGVFIGNARHAGAGDVSEIDAKGKVQWKFELDSYPADAIVLGKDRVLVAEYRTGKISERTFKGELIWERSVNGNPISLQRLPNGNIFVVMQNGLFELDGAKKEVFTFNRIQQDLLRARKLRNHEVVFITNKGEVNRIDSRGQSLGKVINVGQVSLLFGAIDVLPNGHLLVPEFQAGRVVEYDRSGHPVGRTITVQWPNSAERLPNGHTLVASQNSRQVTEFDRGGHIVWSHQCDGNVVTAHRR